MKEKLIELLKISQFQNRKLSGGKIAFELETTERHVRAMVEEIRREGVIEDYYLVSSDDGYYLSDDADEVNKFLNVYLAHAFSRIETAKSAKKFLSEQQAQGIQTQLQF